MNTIRLSAFFSASILSIGVITSSGLAQVHHRCPCPCPPTADPDSQLDEVMEDRQPEDLPEVADLAAEAAIASGPQAALPYMLGDLLKANRSIAYNIHRAGAQADFESGGAIGFRNAKVAENNNALPQDRFYVRYNYFSNAIRVRGLSQDTRIIR